MSNPNNNSSSEQMETESIPPVSNKDPKPLRVFETFSWENVQSNLTNLRPPSSRIPPATDRDSAFLDLQKMPPTLNGKSIADALPDTAIGTKFRADTKFIQIFFEDETEAD